MPEILTRILLIALLVWLVWYVIKNIIPESYLTILGGLVLVLFLLLLFQDPSDRILGALWEVISFPLKPLGLSIILLILALRKGIKGADGNLVLWALVILWLFSTPLIAYWLMLQTQQGAEQLAARTNDIAVVNVIAVLGDGVSPADPAYRGGTQFSDPDDGFDNTFVSRLLYSAELYAQQRALGGDPLVIVSPGPQLERPTKDIREDIQAILVGAGVPPGQIRVDEEGRDIRSSAVAIREILNEQEGYIERGYRVMLVAPAVKIRRARAAFAKALGVLDENVVAAPTDFYGFQIQGGDIVMRLNDVVPDVEALTLSTRVIEEYLATVYYFLRGWLLNPLGL